MKKFFEFINEAGTSQASSVDFIYNDEKCIFSSNSVSELYSDILDWLYKSGYKFTGDIHNTSFGKIYTLDEVEKLGETKGVPFNRFHELDDDKYMSVTWPGNIQIKLNAMVEMLKNFGVDVETIQLKNNEIIIEKDLLDIDHNTFIGAAYNYMKTATSPLRAKDIWINIKSVVKTGGKTPINSLYSILLGSSDNSGVALKSKKILFHIVENNPAKFWLISRMDELDGNILKKHNDFINSLEDPDWDENAEKEAEKNELVEIEPIKNPFVNSLCVLGESGAGKSVTIENILDDEDPPHNCIIILPSITMTSLLVQYDLDTRKYVLSRLGRHIERAMKNPDQLYTVIFDECHLYLDKINNEILQAMSEKRNKGGIRFISLDPSTEKLYGFLNIDPKERHIIPQNLGFIFISSNDDAILGNKDFKNRIDWVFIKENERDLYKRIQNLLDKREERNEHGKSS